MPPRTYAAWAELLTQCGQGHDAVLDALAQGSWQPDAGTAIRFANLVNETYAARKRRWLDAFSRSQAAGGVVRSPPEFALLLRQATANLHPLRRLVALPALPANLRDTLQADLATFVQDVANSLRDNVLRQGGNQREELLLALRGFGIPSAPVVPAAPAAVASAGPAAAPAAGRGRRIIL